MNGISETQRNALADPKGEFWQTYMAPIKSAKQQLFVLEYIKDFNGAEAHRRAGYKGNNNAQCANDLLNNPRIATAVEAAKAYRLEVVAVDAAYVLRRLHDIDQMDVLDILRDDLTLKPLNQWPKVWRQSISAVDINESILKGSDSQADTISILKKIKWPEKVKILELIGKHTEVRAFVEQKEVNGRVTIESLIDELTS